VGVEAKNIQRVVWCHQHDAGPSARIELEHTFECRDVTHCASIRIQCESDSQLQPEHNRAREWRQHNCASVNLARRRSPPRLHFRRQETAQTNQLTLSFGETTLKGNDANTSISAKMIDKELWSPDSRDFRNLSAKHELVDLNSATKEQLAALPGIGDAYADQIIAGCPYNQSLNSRVRKAFPLPA
jgi:Helix-hairpin-helix motif